MSSRRMWRESWDQLGEVEEEKFSIGIGINVSVGSRNDRFRGRKRVESRKTSWKREDKLKAGRGDIRDDEDVLWAVATMTA
jgi:hypothetical protein